ncbi:hypothetical protein WSM22_02810 [Cytophagales bacterium WSM2-2]|nr:hypothetical protein WSM22_02810 [Cytophagales bacterium WSM2-2]
MKLIVTFFIYMICIESILAQRQIGVSGTQATVYEDPEFVKRDFKKVVIKTGVDDMDQDEKVMKEFESLKVEKISWLKLFPPIKEYNDSSVARICKSNGVDGIIKMVEKSTEVGAGVYAQGSKRAKFELTVIDVATMTNVAKYTGGTAITALDVPLKTYIKFARLTRDDLNGVLKKSR